MSLPSTEPFRREQLDLLGHVERLPVTAHELRSLPVDERIELIEEVVTFLAEMLLPHVEVEERVLYPGADRLLGDAGHGGPAAHTMFPAEETTAFPTIGVFGQFLTRPLTDAFAVAAPLTTAAPARWPPRAPAVVPAVLPARTPARRPRAKSRAVVPLPPLGAL